MLRGWGKLIGADCVLKGCPRSVDLTGLVLEPLGRPDPMELPSKALQVLLPQPVAVSRTLSRVVCSSIALDRQHPAIRNRRMRDDEVDPISRDAVLRAQGH